MGRSTVSDGGQGMGAGRAAGRVWLPVAFAALLLAVGLCRHSSACGHACSSHAFLLADGLWASPETPERSLRNHPGSRRNPQRDPIEAVRSPRQTVRTVHPLRAGRAARWVCVSVLSPCASLLRADPQHAIPHHRAEYGSWNGVGTPLR